MPKKIPPGEPCVRGDIASRNASGACTGPACVALRKAKQQQRIQATDRTRYARITRAQLEKDPRAALLSAAKYRARKQKLPFNLQLSDIFVPKFCPVLGLELKMAVGIPAGSSPSIDKIIPSLGYIKGNIAVISHRANLLKRDASPQELMAVAQWSKFVTGMTDICRKWKNWKQYCTNDQQNVGELPTDGRVK